MAGRYGSGNRGGLLSDGVLGLGQLDGRLPKIVSDGADLSQRPPPTAKTPDLVTLFMGQGQSGLWQNPVLEYSVSSPMALLTWCHVCNLSAAACLFTVYDYCMCTLLHIHA